MYTTAGERCLTWAKYSPKVFAMNVSSASDPTKYIFTGGTNTKETIVFLDHELVITLHRTPYSTNVLFILCFFIRTVVLF